jgi:hypothetical protein
MVMQHVHTTTKWDGWGKITNKIIKENFDEEITTYVCRYYKQLASFFHNRSDVCDLMYVLTCDDDYFTTMQRHFWILAVAYTLVTIYDHIDFSCSEYKYFYLEKITRIRNRVCDHIQYNITK